MGWVVACASEIVASIKKEDKVASESREMKYGFICDLSAAQRGREGRVEIAAASHFIC